MSALVLLATLIFLIDQTTKFIVCTYLPPGKSIAVIPHLLYFTRVHNTGIAFGLFRDYDSIALLLVVFGCVILGIILFTMRHESRLQRSAGALIIGGAVGNIIDRIRFGAVIDFIDLRVWPVFNVADMCISIAAFLFILSLFRVKK